MGSQNNMERKITAVYVNRYRQGRYLHDDGKGEIWMTGDISYTRCGGDAVDGRITNITYVDTDGGPFISLGDDLNEYYQDGYSRIVESIKLSGVIKLKYKLENNG